MKMKGRYSGSKNPNYGKLMPDEQKRKISLSRRGKCSGSAHWNWKGGIAI